MVEFEYIFDLLKKNILGVAGILVGILAIIGSVFYTMSFKCPICEKNECDIAMNIESEEEVDFSLSDKIRVDVKGAVKKPGVYELDRGKTIQDAISMAGGVATSGTTVNINLSKKLTDEMVVYVFTKDEIKKAEVANEVVCEVPKCECETVTVVECPDINGNNNNSSSGDNSSGSQVTKKVSINTASIEELQTISGVGESKAQAIIEYREANGGFASIEDIKKVSGIGDALYEKIKDEITV